MQLFRIYEKNKSVYRRIIFILSAILVMALLFAGCGRSKKAQAPKSNSQTTVNALIAPDAASASGDTDSKDNNGPTVQEGKTTHAEGVQKDKEDSKEEAATKEATAKEEISQSKEQENADSSEGILEDGIYTTKDEVALYIHTYNRLPQNFVTKKDAQALGWQGGGLDDFIDCGCIGGSYFGNYEGALPEKKGRKYYECDIDTMHKSKRGSKRIVYSDDGLIYYTDDHYETFELLYGEE